MNSATATGAVLDLTLQNGAARARVDGCCPGDYNGDEAANDLDIFDFLAGWFAGYEGADFDNNGSLSVGDLFAFLRAWFVGC